MKRDREEKREKEEKNKTAGHTDGWRKGTVRLRIIRSDDCLFSFPLFYSTSTAPLCALELFCHVEAGTYPSEGKHAAVRAFKVSEQQETVCLSE